MLALGAGRRRVHLLTFLPTTGAQLVIGGAAVGVFKRFVCLTDVGETLLRIWLFADVRVVFTRLLAVGSFDIVRRGFRRNADDAVVILKLHGRLTVS